VVGIIVAGWLLVAWVLVDAFLMPHPDPIGELLGHSTRPPQTQTYILLVGIVAMMAFMTRALCFVLRCLREMPTDHAARR
jgi:hypothetical protein